MTDKNKKTRRSLLIGVLVTTGILGLGVLGFVPLDGPPSGLLFVYLHRNAQLMSSESAAAVFAGERGHLVGQELDVVAKRYGFLQQAFEVTGAKEDR